SPGHDELGRPGVELIPGEPAVRVSILKDGVYVFPVRVGCPHRPVVASCHRCPGPHRSALLRKPFPRVTPTSASLRICLLLGLSQLTSGPPRAWRSTVRWARPRSTSGRCAGGCSTAS